MKFQHKQFVRVTNGFFKGEIGIVHEVSTWRCVFGSEPRYLIFIEINCLKWFKESDLEIYGVSLK